MIGLSAAFILFGLRNLQTWGPLVARHDAPFSLLKLSPAPMFILLGILLDRITQAAARRADVPTHVHRS